MRPKFNSIYKGPWPYNMSEGVGILIEGHPTEIPSLQDMMWQYSCHHAISEEIVKDLLRTGERRVTLMCKIDFDALAIDFARFGLKMSIIPPKVPERTQEQLMEVVREWSRDQLTKTESGRMLRE